MKRQDHNFSPKMIITIGKNDFLKIICDPFFCERGLTQVESNSSYDVYKIPQSCPGEYIFQLCLTKGGDGKECIEVRRSHAGGLRLDNREIHELVFDIGVGVIHVARQNLRHLQIAVDSSVRRNGGRMIPMND